MSLLELIGFTYREESEKEKTVLSVELSEVLENFSRFEFVQEICQKFLSVANVDSLSLN